MLDVGNWLMSIVDSGVGGKKERRKGMVIPLAQYPHGPAL